MPHGRTKGKLPLTNFRDASLGYLSYFRQVIADPDLQTLASVRKLFTEERPAKIRVLEVGAGCGIVGIALAQLLKSDVVLTDLEDAQAIMQSNLERAVPRAGSTVRRQVLGWGSSLGDLSSSKFDLVLVSDCIYNPDSSILLVETLELVSKLNPNVLIFVGYKRRHDADDTFFQRMQDARFSVVESGEVLLPHIVTEYDASKPKVEMFVYAAPK